MGLERSKAAFPVIFSGQTLANNFQFADHSFFFRGPHFPLVSVMKRGTLHARNSSHLALRLLCWTALSCYEVIISHTASQFYKDCTMDQALLNGWYFGNQVGHACTFFSHCSPSVVLPRPEHFYIIRTFLPSSIHHAYNTSPKISSL